MERAMLEVLKEAKASMDDDILVFHSSVWDEAIAAVTAVSGNQHIIKDICTSKLAKIRKETWSPWFVHLKHCSRWGKDENGVPMAADAGQEVEHFQDQYPQCMRFQHYPP
jgi:hypothetical protein